MKILLALSALLVLVNVSCCVQFSSEIDKRIRRSLSAALKRFHLNYNLIFESTETSIDPLSDLPTDYKKRLFETFLDVKSLIETSKTCRYFEKFSAAAVSQKLRLFNPHFATEDSLVNNLLLAVLSEHFKDSTNLRSSSIQDELQLLILKYIYDQLSFNVIPKNIYLYIIVFINEAVFGVEATVPLNREQVKIDFVRRLRTFNLPKCFEFFQAIERTFWLQEMAFFHSRPTKEELIQKYGIPEIDFIYNALNREKEFEFQYAILEIFQNPREELNQLHFSFREGAFHRTSLSRELFEAAVSRTSTDGLMISLSNFVFVDVDLSSKSLSLEHKSIICHELRRRSISILPVACQFYTSSLLNELPPSQYEAVRKSELIRDNRTNLYRINLISNLIEYDAIDYLDILSMTCASTDLYLESAIKDSKQPWRLFQELEVSMNPYILMHKLKKKYFDIMCDVLKRTDPFIFLTLSMKTLKALKVHIKPSSEFSEKIYDFSSLKLLSKFPLFKGKTRRFLNRKLSFLEILHGLKNHALNNIFGI